MNTTTPGKTPSNELASLIKETIETYFTARELWSRVLEKGKQEGFTEKGLQDITMPLLKDRLALHQTKYLFVREETHETSKTGTPVVDYPISVEFYKELDAMAELEKESRDSISAAIKIAKENGFSNGEIEVLIREHLKDSVPKDLLDDWLKPVT